MINTVEIKEHNRIVEKCSSSSSSLSCVGAGGVGGTGG